VSGWKAGFNSPPHSRSPEKVASPGNPHSDPRWPVEQGSGPGGKRGNPVRFRGCPAMQTTRLAPAVPAHGNGMRKAVGGSLLWLNRPVGGLPWQKKHFLLPTQPIHRTTHRVTSPDSWGITRRPRLPRAQLGTQGAPRDAGRQCTNHSESSLEAARKGRRPRVQRSPSRSEGDARSWFFRCLEKCPSGRPDTTGNPLRRSRVRIIESLMECLKR
jgi:hypothetical protein